MSSLVICLRQEAIPFCEWQIVVHMFVTLENNYSFENTFSGNVVWVRSVMESVFLEHSVFMFIVFCPILICQTGL